MSVQKLLKLALPNFYWRIIASSSALKDLTWRFTPAGAQRLNGATKSFDKMFKKSLLHLYKNAKLNYAELHCAFKRIANILHNRPVPVQQTKPFSEDEDFLSHLTPNQFKNLYFHSLLPTRKWIEAKRNLAPGDLVLVQYSKNL